MSRFIVITSGKGGVGKTTTAVNLATAMHSFDEDVTLVDVNFTTPNVGLHLGAPVVPISLNHVLRGESELTDAVYEHSSGTKVIPCSLSIKELKRLNERDLLSVAKDLRKLSDIVIFDSAAGLGSEATTSLKIADDVIIVTNPEMPAVTDALKIAKYAEGMGKNVLGVVVTRVRGNKYEMSLTSVKEMLELPILGVIPEEPRMQESLSMRNAIFFTHPKSKAAKNYYNLAADILGKRAVQREIGFWAGLKSKLFG